MWVGNRAEPVRGADSVIAVADLDRVKVVITIERPAAVGGLPRGEGDEPPGHVGVVGQPLAAVVLDVRGDFPLGGVPVQRRAEGGGVAAFGNVELHRTPRLPNRAGPGLDVGPVAVGDAVELDEVHSPAGEFAGDGVDVCLGAGPGVVDARHAPTVVVVLPGPGGDVIGGVT